MLILKMFAECWPEDDPLGSKHVAVLKNTIVLIAPTTFILSINQAGEVFRTVCTNCVQVLTTFQMTQHKTYTVIPPYTSNRFTTFSCTRDSQIKPLAPEFFFKF